ncbi:MAG: glucoamylase [Clostridia bacterium]|nr:glucoamylase [Clostridia bacterium]
MLVTVGSRGQAQNIYWPHPDYWPHLGRIVWGLKKQERLYPSDGPHWEHELSYLPEAILEGKHFFKPLNLVFKESTWVDAGRDLWVRQLLFPPRPAAELEFWAYFHFHLGEIPRYHTYFYWRRYGALICYRQGLYLAVACRPLPRRQHCGQLGGRYDPILALIGGRLLSHKKGIGHAAAVLSWGPEWPEQVSIYLLPGTSLRELAASLKILNETDAPALREKTRQYWGSYLDRSRPVPGLNSSLTRLYRISLTVLKLLQDAESGAIIAAPEIDPNYSASGGYAYCWSRDAVYAAWALAESGYPEMAARYYAFARLSQGEDGLWGQRHYTSGLLAPNWGRQLDETGTVLWGIGKHYQITGDRAFLEDMWPVLARGAEGLERNLAAHGGRPGRSYDLWEERRGDHAYTWAAVAAGLRAAAAAASALGKKKHSRRWQTGADALVAAIPATFWDEDRRTFRSALGRRGLRLDASLLGLAFPFEVLAPDDKRLLATADRIEAALWNGPTGGIMRYAGDRYVGGNPWILTTLWLAIYRHLVGAEAHARRLFLWAVEHGMSTGLLAEQVDKYTGKPLWATPLAWSHSFYLLALHRIFGGLK